MYEDIHEHPTMPIGFARSLLWALGVTCIVGLSAASYTSAHRVLILPASLIGAAILYPLVTGAQPRRAVYGAIVAGLLLVPSLESSHRPWAVMLAAAVVIGLVRGWYHWDKEQGLPWQRELCSLVGSVALGAYLFDASNLGISFGVWGFCLGQVVSTLFRDEFQDS